MVPYTAVGTWEKEEVRGITVVSVMRQRSRRPLVATEAEMLRRQPDLERSGEKSGVGEEFAFEEPSA